MEHPQNQQPHQSPQPVQPQQAPQPQQYQPPQPVQPQQAPQPQQYQQSANPAAYMDRKTSPAQAVHLAREKADAVVLGITVVATLGVFLIFGVVLNAQLLFLFVLTIFVIFFYIRLFQISFLGNALRVQSGRHAYLLTIVNNLSMELKMPEVDVFITQDPYLNAFAVGYHHPYTIVLHSATVDELSQEELLAILTHEMGHIKYRHTTINAYIQPFGILVPILGPIVQWLFGFWSRRAELACDRLATAYIGDPHIVASALMKVHVGSKFSEYLTEEGVYNQDVYSEGFMRKLSQSLSSHPFLVTRVREVYDFSNRNNSISS